MQKSILQYRGHAHNLHNSINCIAKIILIVSNNNSNNNPLTCSYSLQLNASGREFQASLRLFALFTN